MNERADAIVALLDVKAGRSLNTRPLSPFAQEACYGVLRHYFYLLAIIKLLAHKSVQDDVVLLSIMVGLYQLIYMQVAEHAAINETVEALVELKKQRMKGFANAVLRNFQRQKQALLAKVSEQDQISHPIWLQKKLKACWGDKSQQIMQENNKKPPMHLRVNQQKIARDDYLRMLLQAGVAASVTELNSEGITLDKPVAINKLPGFFAGLVSVQDIAAQMSAELLEPLPGQMVLDACCAPGGKLCHILEVEPAALVTGIDLYSKRMTLVQDNLQRLGLRAELQSADILSWQNTGEFDRILLDAPCSATGVIRRHPDIKLLRKKSDIAQLAGMQLKVLQKLWQMLKPGGILLYATCSVLREENDSIMTAFEKLESKVQYERLNFAEGLATKYGWQFLPTAKGPDGFYYAKLRKTI